MTPSVLHDVVLDTMSQEEMPLAAGVAARSMLDNPSSLALFGSDRMRRVRALEPVYHMVLATGQRQPMVARRHGIIVGLAAMSSPGECFSREAISRERTLRVGGRRITTMLPSIPRQLVVPLLCLGPRALSRLSAWGEANVSHDPHEPHHHIELVAVEPGLQGLGIGRLMMDALCAQMARRPGFGYLETDTESNVRFYRHYGFEVVAEVTVLGTRTWYMVRPAT